MPEPRKPGRSSAPRPRAARQEKLVRLERVGGGPPPPPPEPEISLKWFKAGVGVLLLPLCWVATAALFEIFNPGQGGSLWQTREVGLFSCGVLAWLLVFFLLPRPTGLYVLGHEWTHALFTWLCGGRVGGVRATAHGGYVLTSKTNVLISLSPYFVPFWSLVSLGLLGGLRLVLDIPHFDLLLFFCAGATWAFHISFTLTMVLRGQSDLELNGYFFSVVVIYLGNILLIAAFLIIASPSVQLGMFATSAWREFLHLLQSATLLIS